MCLSVSSGDLLTKWAGQSERHVRTCLIVGVRTDAVVHVVLAACQVIALFEVARMLTTLLRTCVVVLIDEIDGLCSEPGATDTSANVRLVQQFQTSFSKCVAFGGPGFVGCG